MTAFISSSCTSTIFLLLSQTKLLTQYVLNLAKYDQNYDIRDRARFIRQLIVPTEKGGALSKYAKKLFLALKPAPILESPFKGTGSNQRKLLASSQHGNYFKLTQAHYISGDKHVDQNI